MTPLADNLALTDNRSTTGVSPQLASLIGAVAQAHAFESGIAQRRFSRI